MKKSADWRPKSYVVQKGDTLYSIALEHGFGYREIADWNGLDDPNRIQVGQELRLVPPPGGGRSPKGTVVAETRPLGNDTQRVAQPKAVKWPYSEKGAAEPLPRPVEKPVEKAVEKPQPAIVAKAPEEKPAERPESDDEGGSDELKWAWPTKGKVLAPFSEGGNKGVDLGGKVGQPVLASEDGKVVYSGSGLRGYGKLIIIKHNKTYLSAYAHNSKLLVKEGQTVSKGQKIAEMGDTDADRVKLHFEIRRLGKPVDPTKLLPSEKS